MTIHPYIIRYPNLALPQEPWTIPALCAAYDWPKNLAGGGVIAVVELGGGWNTSDMVQFFHGIGQPIPTIVDVSVDGTTSSPGSDADGEVALDIQVAGAAYFVATGKPATIRVYWTQDIAAGVRAAAKDGCDVCSISWGDDEAEWGRAAGNDMNTAASEGLSLGMVTFAAAGDNDSSDGGPSAANVDLPASAPAIIGCGGTTKTLASESVWNNNPGNADGHGTGGGYSTFFAKQVWQHGAPMAPQGLGRMVPDVSANADPNTGYLIVLNGQQIQVGGTSAVAPLYAGLFATFGQKLGWIRGKLWGNHACFNDITRGDNGMYDARVGPDACTGLGTPIGTKLSALFVVP